MYVYKCVCIHIQHALRILLILQGKWLVQAVHQTAIMRTDTTRLALEGTAPSK